MNGRTNSSGSSVNDLQIPLDPCTNLECVAGNAQVELTWTDPLNKYATPEGEVAEDPDQLVSVWHHTVVIRKVGSAPVGIDDGIVVVSSEVKNQYQSTVYIDTGLVNDTTYYYGVFAINEDGVESEGLVSEGVTPKLGTPLSELAEGTIIKINENGAPVEFYLAKHNYEPDLNGPGRELLVRKDVYNREICFAGYEETGDSYLNSPANEWLNSTYKNLFSSVIQNKMNSTSFQYSRIADRSASKRTLDEAIFVVSFKEYGLSLPVNYNWHLGSETFSCASQIRIAYLNGSPTSHVTRDIRDHGGTSIVGYVTSTGESEYNTTYGNHDPYYARPCFTLSNSIMCDGHFNILENTGD